jgi:hypothetical protein
MYKLNINLYIAVEKNRPKENEREKKEINKEQEKKMVCTY